VRIKEIGTLTRQEFHTAWAEFKLLLLTKHKPHRYYEELYDHKRWAEISLWWGVEELEEGVVFIARSRDWDGGVDWDRLCGIIEGKEGFLKFDTPSSNKLWDLSDLRAQKEEIPYCDVQNKVAD
jgi:hypothetical protein